MACEITDLAAVFEHVDKHQFRAVGLGRFLHILQMPQDLAGEGAAEVAQENQ